MRGMLHTLAAVSLGVALFASDAAALEAKKKVVFIAGRQSHGFMAHDHKAGCHLLAKRINEIPGFEAVVHYNEWPAAEVLESAAAIVIYSDGGGGHPAIKNKEQLMKLSDKGIGVGTIHYAVEVPKDAAGKEWLDMMGGYFETHFSVNPHWVATFDKLPEHPVSRGVKPFSTNDEWYYHMRFREEMKGVTPILSAVPPDRTRQGKDGPHSGNEHVRAGVGKNIPEHVMWVSENDGASRGFGCTGGHFHRNWAHDDFRRAILNAIVWIAKGEVPEKGIDSKRPDVDEMLANHDEKVPDNFDKEKLAKEIETLNQPPQPKQARRPSADGELLYSVTQR